MNARLSISSVLVALLIVAPTITGYETLGRFVVTVSRDDGTAVGGLGPDDFAIDIDGSRVSPTVVQSRLLSVLVLFDQSASATSAIPLGRVTDGIDSSLSRILQLGDLLRFGTVSGIVTINRHVAGVARTDLQLALRALPPPIDLGASPIWDAVEEGAGGFEGAGQGRLIVLVTDGRASANHVSAEDAARTALEHMVTVSVVDSGRNVVVRQDDSKALAVKPSEALEWISRMTGGRYYQDPYGSGRARVPSSIDSIVSRAVSDQRLHYQLAVPVPNDGRFHELHVQVTAPGRTVRAPLLVRVIGRQSR